LNQLTLFSFAVCPASCDRRRISESILGHS
jgi:hypothetical protein